jgi:CDP-glycerol:poly(glycerophosphate) glycerophosphotransferase/glycosyl transferase family 2
MPRVTVIVTARDDECAVAQALESIFAQSFRDFAVVVLDVGRSPAPTHLPREWYGRIAYRREPGRPLTEARREAIAESGSELVAFLEPGALWTPRKLERQLAYFDRFPETALLHTATRRIGASAPTLESMVPVMCDPVAVGPGQIFADLFHGDVDIDTSTVVARQTVLAGRPVDRALRRLDDDWEMWLRIAAHHAVGFLPARLVIQRSAAPSIDRLSAGRQTIIDAIAPLCTGVCDRHRGDGATCVREARARLHLDVAIARLRAGRWHDARLAMAEALRLSPGGRASAYLAASHVGRASTVAWRSAPDSVLTAGAAPPRNLVHDTMLRRTRQAIARSIHAVDDVVWRAGRTRARVLFEAASPLSLAVFRPVLDRLVTDPRVEIWFTTSDGSWDADRIFAVAGIRERVITTSRARLMKFDAYVNTDFWNMTWLPRRTRRIHLFHGVAGKYGLDAPVRIAPVVASYDRLLFPNRDRLLRYAEAGLVDPESPCAALVGYPKVDCLVDGSLDRDTIVRELDLDPAKPTVLYAPTWSPHSSLNSMGDEVIGALSRLGANVIVKLHDRSLDPTERGSGGVDWRRRLANLCVTRRVHLAQRPDASPYLFVADALVTDHSSVGFEFMLLDRPVVAIDCPELIRNARINPDKVSVLRSASYVVRASADVVAAVRRGLAAPRELSDPRRRVARELFYCPGGATDRAVRCIYEVLRLPVPAPAGGRDVDRNVLGQPQRFSRRPAGQAGRARDAESEKFSAEVG